MITDYEQKLVEELLKQRYKVISDYPEIERHNIKQGDIITTESTAMYCDKIQDGTPVVSIDHEIFPSIFKKLEWWEYRDVKEMPDYLKSNDRDEVYKIERWDMEINFGFVDGTSGCDLALFKPEYGYIPATKQDYLNYKYKNNDPTT